MIFFKNVELNCEFVLRFAAKPTCPFVYTLSWATQKFTSFGGFPTIDFVYFCNVNNISFSFSI